MQSIAQSATVLSSFKPAAEMSQPQVVSPDGHLLNLPLQAHQLCPLSGQLPLPGGLCLGVGCCACLESHLLLSLLLNAALRLCKPDKKG